MRNNEFYLNGYTIVNEQKYKSERTKEFPSLWNIV